MRLNKRSLTDAEAIGDSEEELVEEGEKVVVDEIVVVLGVGVGSHECDGKEEYQSGEEKEEEGVSIEYIIDFCGVFAHSVTDVVHEEDEDDRPASVQAIDLLVEGGAWEEGEGDHKGEHDNKVIGEDVFAGLEQGLEVVLALDALLFDSQGFFG